MGSRETLPSLKVLSSQLTIRNRVVSCKGTIAIDKCSLPKILFLIVVDFLRTEKIIQRFVSAVESRYLRCICLEWLKIQTARLTSLRVLKKTGHAVAPIESSLILPEELFRFSVEFPLCSVQPELGETIFELFRTFALQSWNWIRIGQPVHPFR